MLRENPAVLRDSDIASLVGIKIDTSESIGKYLDMTETELYCAGFDDASVMAILGIKELMSRYLSERMGKGDVLTSPERVVSFLRAKIGGLPHEAFMVIFLTTQNEVIQHEVINQGTIDQVAVYPRRIIEAALKHHAGGLIIAHNHPSGYTDPSEEDKSLTATLRNACKLMDIRLLDHIIVGKSGYFSFIERGLL